jgi:ring-1,2-phenylacetyl-CoA epoxidase subunit PaaE
MAFHTLTVAAVEKLCDDAAAVTFDVPDELRGDYAFAAGQSLALRRVVDGVEERRSYSICAPVGSPPRVGVREVPDGLFSSWLVREVRPGARVEVQTAGSGPTRPPAGGTCASPPAPGSPRCSRSRRRCWPARGPHTSRSSTATAGRRR